MQQWLDRTYTGANMIVKEIVNSKIFTYGS